MLIKQGSTKSVIVWAGSITGAGVSLLNTFTVGSTLYQNGSAATGFAGSVTFLANGTYEISLAAADTGVLGDLAITLTDGANFATFHLGQVVPWDPEDVAGLGLTNLDAAISTVVAGVATVLTDLGTVLTDLGTLGTSVGGVPAALLDLAAGVETGFTVRQIFRIAAAALAGKISIAGTVLTFRSINDTKNRIICTVDGTGQRLSFTFDLT